VLNYLQLNKITSTYVQNMQIQFKLPVLILNLSAELPETEQDSINECAKYANSI